MPACWFFVLFFFFLHPHWQTPLQCLASRLPDEDESAQFGSWVTRTPPKTLLHLLADFCPAPKRDRQKWKVLHTNPLTIRSLVALFLFLTCFICMYKKENCQEFTRWKLLFKSPNKDKTSFNPSNNTISTSLNMNFFQPFLETSVSVHGRATNPLWSVLWQVLFTEYCKAGFTGYWLLQG